jgi:hypothetical protein
LRRAALRAAFFAGLALRALFRRDDFLPAAFLAEALRRAPFRRGALRFAFLFATVSPPVEILSGKSRFNTPQASPFVKMTAR